MQLAYHYLRLRSRFSETQEGQPIPVSLQQLADILCCTNRNTNLILKRMIDLRWIERSSGRGRGNLSQITFLVSKESFLLDTAKQLVEKGEIRQALELLNEADATHASMMEFIDWLNTQFGYCSKVKEEQQIDTLRLPLFKKRWALDPAYALFSNEAHFIRQIFDCLVRFNPKTRQNEPQLAHHWEVNEDSTEWTFYLRKGVLFHHRRVLTASDVVFSLRRVLDAEPPSPFRRMFSHIQEIKTLSSHSLQIKLREPNHLFLHALSSHAASILPEDMFGKLGTDFSRLPVGTGPFRVTTHDKTALILEAFTDYFQERAHLDRVEILLLPELEQYESKLTMDAFQMKYIPNQQCNEISPDWQDTERLQNGCRFLSLNVAKPGPQQNPLFRKALRLSIDRSKLVSVQENSIIAKRLFPEYEKMDHQVDYDPVEAKKLLNEAGYLGETLHLYTFANHENDALKIQERCKQAGINLEITILPLKAFITMHEVQQADIALCDVVFDENIIFAFMELFHTEHSFIRGYLDPKLLADMERQIATCLREPNQSQQLKAFLELELQLIELGVIVPLLRRREKTYFHPAIKGVSPRSFGWANFNDLWFQPNHRV